MKFKKLEKKISFKNWLIKRLLSDKSTKEEVLKFITSGEDTDNINELEDNNEKNLIKNILDLDNKSVEDIMVPRAEIISIEKNQSISEILEVIKTESHSRMPVYENNLDNVIGFLHIKDLIKNISDKNFKLESVIRDVLYVAPKSPILNLLERIRSSRIHMCLVVDEFGGVDGLVTIEDLVEEIVGEIEDEHDGDDVDNLIKKIDEKTILVTASYKIADLEKYFQVDIQLKDEEEIDTIGGMIFFIANKVPINNQIYKYKDILQFKIIEASTRKIESIEIKKIG
tara:strand:- start:217 stop:1068 length:852 start_codon:yes stop_codon:yes gene_type:complete